MVPGRTPGVGNGSMTIRDVFRLVLLIPWVIFLIYWIIGAFKTRPTREEESLASRYLVVVLETAAYLLVFNRSTEIGFLGERFIPRTLSGAVLGVLLTWIGIGLAIWARYHLAEYWSIRVTIKEDHQLIRTGPYAHLRHPIYSGLVLATMERLWSSANGDACWALSWRWLAIASKPGKKRRC